MVAKTTALALLAFSALLLSACAAQTNFDLVVKRGGEEKKYSFTCDNREDLQSCLKAETLLQKPDKLTAPDLNFDSCSPEEPGPESLQVEIWGRIKKEDVEALFFKGGSPCQEKRWQKIVPLLKSLS